MSDTEEPTGSARLPADVATPPGVLAGSMDPAALAAGPREGDREEPESEEERLALAMEDALDFVDGLLEAMDIDGDATAEIRDHRVYVSIDGAEAAVLIGHHGQTLDAIQELLRSAVQRQVRARVWVTLDVEGYRERRREALRERAREFAARALDEGEVELEPMNAFERKIVHDAVGEIDGVMSFSEGEEPYRRVVIAPAEED